MVWMNNERLQMSPVHERMQMSVVRVGTGPGDPVDAAHRRSARVFRRQHPRRDVGDFRECCFCLLPRRCRRLQFSFPVTTEHDSGYPGRKVLRGNRDRGHQYRRLHGQPRHIQTRPTAKQPAGLPANDHCRGQHQQHRQPRAVARMRTSQTRGEPRGAEEDDQLDSVQQHHRRHPGTTGRASWRGCTASTSWCTTISTPLAAEKQPRLLPDPA